MSPAIVISRPPIRRRAWRSASSRIMTTAASCKTVAEKHRGEIVDLNGRVLGHHDGIEFYTIGQRKGLALRAQPYGLELNAEENRVVVGPVENSKANHSRSNAVTGSRLPN